MSEHLDAEDEPGQKFDSRLILVDRSTRTKLEDHELQELHGWLSERTIVFRRGKYSKLAEPLANEARDESSQTSESEDDNDSENDGAGEDDTDNQDDDNDDDTSMSNDTNIKGLISDTQVQFLVPYDEACRRLGLDPYQPKVFPERDFVLKPHQVTGICAAHLRECDALPFHILADDCGLGKTCQILGLIYYRNLNMIRRGAKDYKVTLILAPQSTCTNWIHDARRMFPPGSKGLQIWTFYWTELHESTPNYKKIDDLLNACAGLKPEDPITGRTVILSTYTTFIKHGMPINRERQKARHEKQHVCKSYRSTDFASEDFDLVWNVPVERIVADEGHKAKHQDTKINVALRTLACNNFWFVSATPLYNAVEDILGITKLLKKYQTAPNLGIPNDTGELEATPGSERQNDVDALRDKAIPTNIDDPDTEPNPGTEECLQDLTGQTILERYQSANEAWKSNVNSWKAARSFRRNQIISDFKPWYNRHGIPETNIYRLRLLDHDTVVKALEGNLDEGRIRPNIAKEIVGFVLRMLMIRRTRTSVETVMNHNGRTQFISPGDGMAKCIVSTVDLAPGYAEHEFYQDQLAPNHSDRINNKVRKGLLKGQNDPILNSTNERLSVAGTAHPIIAQDIMELLRLQEEAREEAKDENERLKLQRIEPEKKKRKRNPVAEPFDDDELRYCEKNKDALVWKDHLPLGRARTYDDRYATHWYFKTPEASEVNIPSSRMEMLKHLLVDSTKYRYMAMALIRAKLTEKRVVIFVTYPIQQIFLETIACLLDVPVISMFSGDDAALRHSKIEEFNNPAANVFAFISTNLIAGQSLNLHKCCNYMIQCDISGNLNAMLQMKGRVDCVGQGEETLIEILALDYTLDVHRQGCVAQKMIPVISAMMEHESKSDLSCIGEHYIRTAFGQSCSRAEWRATNWDYRWDFSYNQEDPQITKDHKTFDELLEKYHSDYQVSDELGQIHNKVLAINLSTN